MPEGVCASCNFYNPFVGICEIRRQYVPPTGICDEYTALEGDYEGESIEADT